MGHRIPVHHDLLPPRAKDILTGLYAGGLLDTYAKKAIMARLEAKGDGLKCPHCHEPITIQVTARDE